MTIVYPDAYTLNPGDLSWAPLQALGDVVFYDHTPTDELLERVSGAEAILVNKIRLNRSLLQQLPRLKYIGVTATGYDIIDVAAAREQGIVVSNVKGYSTDSVAQQTFALLLELTNHVGLHNESVHAGDWVKSPDFCYWRTPLVELSGKTLGLIGYGDIGRKVAEIGRAFGMNVLVNRRHPPKESVDGIRFVDVETVFSESDVVSLHCPATPETIGFVNYALMSKMKPSAYLINTSRGSLLNEAEVSSALNEGLIAGAGIDVLSLEPPEADNPLLTAKNCLITPHVAWATYEARQRLLERVVENLSAFMNGNPINVVS
ncbi:D-isomer specific 2-hydroxyacid dehydrogenase NAD-binding [Fibrisoma limi BUZ 3]|uniref:D-isomer specific 2-hydroxyacid dehydrogenase NAD-binding n=1 Tax=Fibrisoma limi BUZ 3 TaxID=1185876 RepID=I2GR67_9BACT|nr:D-2-hydroxyacid dehydrogenase [Fibrisoma limi]CCH56395.1 D-isomer specific 2-hydroxyacid dehydrogenase NAD-binding [Fibrisoma limi BUZ 3]